MNIFPAGTKIVKVDGESGDMHPVLTTGVVVSHLFHPQLGAGYFVHWDGDPENVMGFVVDWKIKERI